MQKRRINKWSLHLILICSIAFSLLGCKGTDNTTTSTSDSKADFTKWIAPLEGTWKGRILTYSDPRGQVDETPQPKDIQTKDIIKRPTKTEGTTIITQTFTNEGPFKQRVKIVEKQKGKNNFTNHGVRKIENNIITSSINKLTGTDQKTGHVDKDGNFIWIKESKNPKVLEFHKHIKEGNKIRVIGWGYYGEDDLSKAPRIWYFGDVKKVD